MMAEDIHCAVCKDPLITVLVDSEDVFDESLHDFGSRSNSTAPKTVSDDVWLSCNCHFHWECLMNLYSSHACPVCSSELTSKSSSGKVQIICSLNNEGGLSEGVDILPNLEEEAYLRTYPEHRKSRAFLEFCRNGDVPAIVEMTQEPDDDGNTEEQNGYPILQYQDPLDSGRSGLHTAVIEGHADVAWLLLLLGSSLNINAFPPAVLREAEALGVKRGEGFHGEDIRTIRDSQGLTPEELAAQIGGIWTGWIEEGLLAL